MLRLQLFKSIQFLGTQILAPIVGIVLTVAEVSVADLGLTIRALFPVVQSPKDFLYISYIYIYRRNESYPERAGSGVLVGRLRMGSNPGGGIFLSENVTISTYSEGGQNGQRPYVFNLFCHFRNPLRGCVFKMKYSPLKHI